MSNTNDKEGLDTLCEYYDAISAEQYEAVPPHTTISVFRRGQKLNLSVVSGKVGTKRD